MNARLYDANLHRFLSPDTYIQDPYNTQNYNRYGYCVNNPLKYTDVTGNTFNIATLAGALPVIGGIIGSLLMHQPINWGQVAIDAVMTGVSIAVTAGIGTACSTIANFYTRTAVSALAHGLFQGGVSSAMGGKFWVGFAAGALSSVASSFMMGGEDFTHFKSINKTTVTHIHKGIAGSLGINKTVGTLAFGTIMGGAGAALAGGNFWQGAVSGLMVSGLNHALHDDGDGIDPPGKRNPNNMTPEERNEYWRQYNEKVLLPLNEKLIDFAMIADGLAGASEFLTYKAGSFWSATKSLFTTSSSSKILVQFGKGENQVYHAFRHTEKMGLSTSAVKKAILKDIPRISNNVTYGGKTIYTQIKVSGQDIIYSAHRLQNGTINVGRITGL